MAPIVLITGGSQGIGQATAHLFAQKGYDLVIAARQADRLEAAAEAIRSSYHREVLAVPTDVRDPEQVQNLVDRALEKFGAIDILVNNAGIYISGPVESFSLDDWHQAIDTNLWGYIHTIYALLPHLLDRKRGTIVNVSSIGGKVPVPYLAPYSTTKFAIAGLTEALQAELAPKGIQVSGIYPNLIKTNFLERAIFRGVDPSDEQKRRQQIEQLLEVPMVEKPEDVAQAIWKAVSERKNEVIVGSATVANASWKLLPNMVQWVMRKTFQMNDRASA